MSKHAQRKPEQPGDTLTPLEKTMILLVTGMSTVSAVLALF